MESKYKKISISHKFENMSRLGYAITGKRGGTPQIKDDIGRVCVFVDNTNGCQIVGGDTIDVAAFDGYGDTYKRRGQCEIKIRKSGQEVFNGSFDELVNKLNPQGKIYKIEPLADGNVLE